MDDLISVNTLDAKPYREGQWIIKLSEIEWKLKNIDDKKRVNTKKPEWWLFVFTNEEIPKDLIFLRVTKGFTDVGGIIYNYRYKGIVREYEEKEKHTLSEDTAKKGIICEDNISGQIVSISLQIYELEQQRNHLLGMLRKKI